MPNPPVFTLPRPQIETLGFSRENRPISIYWYGKPESQAADTRLDTLFVGAFHGDEGISAQLLFRLINALENGALPPEAEALLKQKTDTNSLPFFAILPVLNPDGLIQNRRVNAVGVDLNRNYPTQNWISTSEDSDEGVAADYFPGVAAGSEPETQVMIRLIDRYQPKKIISIHSPYKVLNFDDPARELAEAMALCSGYPVVDDIGYATPGSFGIYAGKERSIAVVTLGLPEFPADPAVTLIDEVWRDNALSLITALYFDV